MRALTAFILMIIFSWGAVTTTVHAKTATWAEVHNWTVTGDGDLQSCWASTAFEDGVGMSIGFARGETAMWIITNIDAVPEKFYDVKVRASTGAKGTMQAVGLKDGKSVAFVDLNETALRALANANQIYVEGLGRYNLSGSKAAMAKAWECYEVLNSY